MNIKNNFAGQKQLDTLLQGTWVLMSTRLFQRIQGYCLG